MADATDPAGELERIEAELAALNDKKTAILARLEDSGAIAQARGGAAAPSGAVAGGQVAVGRDVHGNVILVNGAAGPMDSPRYWRGLGEPGDDELNAATQRYLDLLVDLYRYLDFRGMGISDRVPLRLPLLDMYVPLKARIEMPEGETWTRDLRLAGRHPTDDEAEAIGVRLSTPRSVLELLAEHDGLIVLGDPGAGKTTFLKLLALTLATGQGESLGLGHRLPVLLPLSAYATALEQRDEPLEAFIDRYYQEDRGVPLPIAAMLKRSLERGGAVLLFDGLDEVRELDRRHVVVDRVKDFYCLHRGDGNKFVITSRVVGYREVRPEAEGLGECTLVDFEDDDVEEFIEKWTAALERAASGATTSAAREAERERQELVAAVRTNPGVRSLASNPLLLTILALMKRQDVTLPERRVELYETYVETLLKHWNLARGLDRRGARDLDVVETVKMLAPLALWMHKTSPGRGLVKEGDLFRELESIFGRRGHDDPAGATRRFVADVRRHAGLLLERGGRQYGFIHLTFQEYLAAVALAQKGQQSIDAIVDELADHVGEDAWHEVTLLTVAYLGIVQQREEAASAVVDELIRRAPGPGGAAVLLAGRAVADAWPGGVSEECRQRVVAALLKTVRDSKRVKAPRRAAAARVLADVGDPRREVMTVDEMELCLVPAGPFLMGSDDRDNWAFEREKPLHEVDIPYGFWMARYPVTVAQFRAFLEAMGQVDQFSHVTKQQGCEPVRAVSWVEAREFCRWLTQRWRERGIPADWSVVLPSEAEWEKAARGGTLVPTSPAVGTPAQLKEQIGMKKNPNPARRYPWGTRPDPNRSNYNLTMIGNVSPIGCFRSGASPYGCEEMSGNIFEWTRSLWGDEADQPISYPYRSDDGREAWDTPQDIPRVLRGGWFAPGPRNVRVTYRGKYRPRVDGSIGFRVALAPFTSGSKSSKFAE